MLTRYSRHRSVAAQLGLAFAATLALLVMLGSVSIFQMQKMQAQTSLIQGAAALDSTARDILTQLLNEETAVRGYAGTGKPLFLDRYREGKTNLPLDLDAIDKSRADYPQLAALVDDARPNIDKINQFFANEIDLVAANKREIALGQLISGKKTFGIYRKAAAKIPQQTAIILARQTAALYSVERTAYWSIAIIGGVALVLCAIIATYLGRKISSRLRSITSAMQHIGSVDFHDMVDAYARLRDGDLTATFGTSASPLHVKGHDEITELTETYNLLASGLRKCSDAFNATTRRLQETMHGILDSSHELMAASMQVSAATSQSNVAIAQMSDSAQRVATESRTQSESVVRARLALDEVGLASQQIAAGANDQARSVQASNDAVEHLNNQIASLADLASSLQGAALSATDRARAGGAAMSKTAVAMSTMRDESTKVETTVLKLEERSTAVGEILSAIDDIADQTNLLALNAAIEAARAGDHGRGFAVVAGEIRKLAEGATQSTREISLILSEIRRDSITAADSMRSYASTVESCIGLADEASKALETVNGAIEDTAQIAREVADGSNTMRSASRQVAGSMNSVSAVVEENAAAASEMQQTTEAVTVSIVPIATAAEENSAAAEQLSASASELAAQMYEITASSAGVRNQVEELTAMMTQFKVTEEQATPAFENPRQAALTAI